MRLAWLLAQVSSPFEALLEQSIEAPSIWAPVLSMLLHRYQQLTSLHACSLPTCTDTCIIAACLSCLNPSCILNKGFLAAAFMLQVWQPAGTAAVPGLGAPAGRGGRGAARTAGPGPLAAGRAA